MPGPRMWISMRIPLRCIPVNELREVREALEKKGYTFLSAEPAYIPSTYTALPEDAADKMTRLMDLLDDCDDVQGFWHNWEM